MPIDRELESIHVKQLESIHVKFDRSTKSPWWCYRCEREVAIPHQCDGRMERAINPPVVGLVEPVCFCVHCGKTLPLEHGCPCWSFRLRAVGVLMDQFWVDYYRVDPSDRQRLDCLDAIAGVLRGAR